MAGLFVLALVLFVLWIIAVATHFVASAAIHILLVVAIVLFIFGFFTGTRRPTA